MMPVPIPLHAHNPIHDGQVRPQGRIDIQNGGLYSGGMQQILRPAVIDSGHNAEHVLQREGNPGQMMGLELGNRDNQIHLLKD